MIIDELNLNILKYRKIEKILKNNNNLKKFLTLNSITN
jgi:glutaredoxin-related protein